MKKFLYTFFSLIFLLVFALGVTATAWAAPYGEGSYGEGQYNVGEAAEGVPASNNSGSSGSSGSSRSSRKSDGSCSAAKPSSVPDLFQINASTDRLILFFSPVSSNRDRYYVSYGTEAGSQQYGFEFENNENGVISVDVQALQPNTAYYFRVRAGNSCMPGDWSNELAARTGQRVPSYRWSSLSAIVTNAFSRTFTPAAVKKVEIDTNQAIPAPAPDSERSPQPENVAPAEQPTQPASGNSAPQSTPSFFDKIGNFFKGLFGR